MTAQQSALFVLLLLVLFAVIVIVRTVKIVPQQVSLIIERLGKFSRTLEGGLHFLVPFVDKVRASVDLREQVVSFTQVDAGPHLVYERDEEVKATLQGS